MKKLFLTTCLLMISVSYTVLSAKAEISIKDYMSHDFLDKQGYSEAMLDLVELNKAKTFGEIPPSKLPTNRWQRCYRKIMFYIDPAEDYDTFGKRDIPMRPQPLEIY